MIGYYVHHVGRGHLHRATALARHWVATRGEEVTGLSSLPRPDDWPGPWVSLAPDDASPAEPVDPTANGILHWAPLGDDGMLERTASLSAWLASARPRAVVVDVSVEVLLSVRLHGVPVVSVVLPGVRTDQAHLIGLDAATGLVSAWPSAPEASGMLPGMPHDVLDRIVTVGAVSRLPVAAAGSAGHDGPRRAVLLQGRGGDAMTDLDAGGLAARCPGWEWTVLGGKGEWVADPVPFLAVADVVVTAAGQGSIADLAALRRPCVVVPADRPHAEQATTVRVLDAGPWPVVVCDSVDEAITPAVLERAASLDGGDWASWCDGLAVERFAAEVERVALP